jgi:hypothetical protein
MARPQVADREDGLQICTVVANILNKQSRTVDRGWLSSLGVGRGDNNPHRKNYLVTNCFSEPRTWTDALARPKHRKMDMRFETWKVRSLYRISGRGGWNSAGSGQGPVAGSCECGDEPSGAGATDLVKTQALDK